MRSSSHSSVLTACAQKLTEEEAAAHHKEVEQHKESTGASAWNKARRRRGRGQGGAGSGGKAALPQQGASAEGRSTALRIAAPAANLLHDSTLCTT